MSRAALRPGFLGAVLGTALAPVSHTRGIQGAPDRMVSHAGQILYPAAAYENDRVLLQVMSFATDIGGDFMTVRQPYSRNLTQGGIGLFWRGGVDAGTHPALLGTTFQGGHVALHPLPFSRLAHQLTDCSHK